MSPTKLEFISAWVPSQSWFTGDAAELSIVGGYRLDDPAGEVGIDGIILAAGAEHFYHVPVTYRAAPIDVDAAAQVGNAEHGVLGTRWVTDGAADPVYRQVLANVMVSGAAGSKEIVEDENGARTEREPLVPIQGSGQAGDAVPDVAQATLEQLDGITRIESDLTVIDLVRRVDPALVAREDQYALRGRWPGQETAAILALLYAG